MNFTDSFTHHFPGIHYSGWEVAGVAALLLVVVVTVMLHSTRLSPFVTIPIAVVLTGLTMTLMASVMVFWMGSLTQPSVESMLRKHYGVPVSTLNTSLLHSGTGFMVGETHCNAWGRTTSHSRLTGKTDTQVSVQCTDDLTKP